MELNTTREKQTFKQELKMHCIAILAERVAAARHAMNDAQQSANSEEKSSAGDKYETGRAMSQINRDRSAGHLEEATMELLKLESIDVTKQYNKVSSGSVACCGQLIYFIATGLGLITFNGFKVAALSPLAPLASVLMGKTIGDTITFNKNKIVITDVF